MWETGFFSWDEARWEWRAWQCDGRGENGRDAEGVMGVVSAEGAGGAYLGRDARSMGRAQ